MRTKKMRRAVLIVLAVSVACGSAWAQPVTNTYVFVPEQSTVVQTGGLAGIHETHTITGMFWLTVDFDANTASFGQVDANLSESVYLPTQSLGELFQMGELVSTDINEIAIEFKDNNPPGGPSINMMLTFVGDSVHLSAKRIDVWLDGFVYDLEAVAPHWANTEVVPPNPTSADAVAITVSGVWPDSCIPDGSQVSVEGKEIYFTVLSSSEEVCTQVPTPWELTETVGQLPVGTYSVYVALDRGPFAFMLQFTVIGCVYYVDADAAGARDGSSWADAYNFLQYALRDARSAGAPVEIRVAEGTYTPAQGIGGIPDVNFRPLAFELINGVVVKGGYAGFGEPHPDARDVRVYTSVLSGDLSGNDGPGFANNGENSYHVVSGADTNETAVLDGFTITGGNANGSWMEDNVGGGMFNLFGSPTVTNCTFRANSADYYGGGMYNGYDEGPLLLNCTFSGNSADDGGGMCNQSASPTLANCMFSGNSAGDGGGILCYENSNPTITSCTIVANSASFKGGGIVGGPDSDLTMTNSILWDNVAQFGPQIYLFGGSMAATYSDVQGGYTGEGNIDADPLFVDASGGDFHLAAPSPCIDTGDPDYPHQPDETDLDGNPRVVNGIVDMGVYEFQRLLYVDDDAPGDPGPGDPNVSDPNEDGTEAHPFDAIQEAIDAATDGNTVTVANGTYTGTGNRDIDFKGKAITVRSENGPENCVIDCQGGEKERHRGFYFHSLEDTDSVVEGFTIINGLVWGYEDLSPDYYDFPPYDPWDNSPNRAIGGGIYCEFAGPTISNCVIRNCATELGGGIGCVGGEPVIINCTISDCVTGHFSPLDSGGLGGGVGLIRGCNARIVGCIISDNVGYWNSYGGGIYCIDSSAQISKCRISGNSAPGNIDGGGLYCGPESSMTLRNCVISQNTAENGGGMYNRCDVGPLITNCEFSNNSVSDQGRGGGILNDESEPTLTHCVFIDNEGGRAGGGICNWNCSGVFTDCVFVNNSVPVVLLTGGGGGAVYNGGGAPEFANCIFAGNWAGWGAAMSNVGSVPEVTNCTFAANPGAIVNWMSDCHPKLTNCILWNGGNEVLNKMGATITITYSNVQGGWPGQGNINADPLFADPSGDDYHIVVGSPCIDTGDPNYPHDPNETDLDGNPRVVNGIVDMGAYEFPGLLYVDDDAPNDPGPGDPEVSDPNEDGTEAHPFDTIQEAIGVAQDGHTILVETGTYPGPDVWIAGETRFLGKNITVTSTDPTDSNIVNDTIIKGTVQFSGTEDANCTLTGFTIRDRAFGAIYGNHTHATISHCIISGNRPPGGTVVMNCDGTISNCLITDNANCDGCGLLFPVVFGCDGLIKNCTIANNALGVVAFDGDTMTMENCIIYNNNGFQVEVEIGSTLNISYCDLQGGLEGIEGEGDVNWGLGNIDADPCFAGLGYWDWEPPPCELVEGDYHLKSEGWRWSRYVVHGSHWTYDYVTSRCIDAGNPGSPLRDEVMTVLPEDPNNDWGINLRINMGAYGGTPEASMPPHGWALLADLTNHGIVNWLDLGGQTEDWLSIGNEQPGDLDRNGVVNFADFGLLARDWLAETTWYEPYIVLKIYSDGWGTLLDTIIMSQEGEITISVEEEYPYYDPPLYYIYAFREGYYTELYYCEKGETINVDLDPIVPGLANGVIFMTQQWFADFYLSLADVTVREGDTVVTQFQTDEQGRFAIDLEPGNYYFEFTFDPEVYFEEVEIQGQYQDFFFRSPIMVLKPNIYLYPEETIELDADVIFPHGGQVTTAIPDYNGGWHITVEPSGIIDGQYECLFYESLQPDYGQYDTGWVVAREELEDFFRNNMAQTGFNEKEIDDFVDYWIPILTDYLYYAIYPQYKNELDEMIRLEFSRQPDSVIRLIYSVRGLEDDNFNIQEPVIPPFEREGFTVAEWGVIWK